MLGIRSAVGGAPNWAVQRHNLRAELWLMYCLTQDASPSCNARTLTGRPAASTSLAEAGRPNPSRKYRHTNRAASSPRTTQKEPYSPAICWDLSVWVSVQGMGRYRGVLPCQTVAPGLTDGRDGSMPPKHKLAADTVRAWHQVTAGCLLSWVLAHLRRLLGV